VNVLKSELRLTEQVIRFLIVRLEEGVPLKEESAAPDEILAEEAPAERAVEEEIAEEVALTSSPVAMEASPEPEADLGNADAPGAEPQELEASPIAVSDAATKAVQTALEDEPQEAESVQPDEGSDSSPGEGSGQGV
jgi:hypothetical protein